jgi:hypothetical protein
LFSIKGLLWLFWWVNSTTGVLSMREGLLVDEMSQINEQLGWFSLFWGLFACCFQIRYG